MDQLFPRKILRNYEYTGSSIELMLQFVREIPIRIVIQETPTETRRGFLFKLAAGFEKPVDPYSGMSVDLGQVDSWLGEFKSKLESGEWPTGQSSSWRVDVIQQAQAFLMSKAKKDGAQLVSLDFSEERGGGFAWKAELKPGFYFLKTSELVEVFGPQETFDLVRLDFIWSCHRDKTADLKKMGKKLVRHCSRRGAKHFGESLQGTVGLTLPDESQLSEIEMHYLADSYKITLCSESAI